MGNRRLLKIFNGEKELIVLTDREILFFLNREQAKHLFFNQPFDERPFFEDELTI